MLPVIIYDRVLRAILFPDLITHPARKINVTHIEQSLIKIIIYSGTAAGDVFLVDGKDVAQRLAVPDQRRNKVIQTLKVLRRHVDAGPGGYE